MGSLWSLKTKFLILYCSLQHFCAVSNLWKCVFVGPLDHFGVQFGVQNWPTNQQNMCSFRDHFLDACKRKLPPEWSTDIWMAFVWPYFSDIVGEEDSKMREITDINLCKSRMEAVKMPLRKSNWFGCVNADCEITLVFFRMAQKYLCTVVIRRDLQSMKFVTFKSSNSLKSRWGSLEVKWFQVFKPRAGPVLAHFGLVLTLLWGRLGRVLGLT